MAPGRLLYLIEPLIQALLALLDVICHALHSSNLLPQLRQVLMYTYDGPCRRVRELLESANVRPCHHVYRSRHLLSGRADHTLGPVDYATPLAFPLSLLRAVVLFHLK